MGAAKTVDAGHESGYLIVADFPLGKNSSSHRPVPSLCALAPAARSPWSRGPLYLSLSLSLSLSLFASRSHMPWSQLATLPSLFVPGHTFAWSCALHQLHDNPSKKSPLTNWRILSPMNW